MSNELSCDPLIDTDVHPDAPTDGMGYLRGSADDWDRYARFSGDPGWSWEGIQPYLRKVISIHS